MKTGEYDFEPVRGLPEALPAGETMLWQGAPQWKSIAIRAMHIRGTAIYFAVLLAWYAESKLTQGVGAEQVILSTLRLAFFAGAALALMTAYAWLSARTTVYTITDKRVVIRSGVALPKVLNLPYAKIESANLKTYADGAGDIALALPFRDRVAYLMVWPHVRPWRFNRAEPMLRGIAAANEIAQVLSQALAAASGQSTKVALRPAREVTPTKTLERPRSPALA
jgi:hypothetical protein